MIPPVFVINLDKDKDRLAAFDANMRAHGVKYTRMDAIYGKDALRDRELSRRITPACKVLCSYGIIGCYLSHARLWEQLANDPDAEFYVVVEDDARFMDDTVQVIQESIEKYRTNFDLLSLFTFSDNMSIACFQERLLDGKYAVCRNPMLLSTLGYIVSKQGARKLLEKMGKASYHVDFMLNMNQVRGIRYWSVSPNVLINDGFLDSNVVGDDVQIMNPIDWGLKTVILSLFQRIQIRNGHVYAGLIMLLAYTVFYRFWWLRLIVTIVALVLFLTTPF